MHLPLHGIKSIPTKYLQHCKRLLRRFKNFLTLLRVLNRNKPYNIKSQLRLLWRLPHKITVFHHFTTFPDISYIHTYIHTYIHQKEIIKNNLPCNFLVYPWHQHNPKENVDQRKTNLGWCCHLHHQPLSQGFLLELSNCHSLDLSNLTLPLLPLNTL